MTTSRPHLPLLALLGTLVISGVAGAQTSYVDRALAASHERRARDGYSAPHAAFQARVAEGGRASTRWKLEGGRSYAIEAVCDEACGDVDIVVRDRSGRIVARDTDADDVPRVAFTPDAGGEYTVEFPMAECSASACGIGARVYVRHRQPTDASREVIDRLMAPVTQSLRTRRLSAGVPAIAYGVAEGDGVELVSFVLTAGRAYAVVGVCDYDCDDLDLAVMAPGGAVVGRDLDDDDVPVVEFVAPESGVYTVAVSMASCSTSKCVFGVSSFGRDGAESGAVLAGSSGAGSATCTTTGTRRTIGVGERVTGQLAPESCRRGDGSHAEYYRLTLSARTALAITLRSSDFDAYLELHDAGGRQVARDDDSDGGTDARIAMTLDAGTYYVIANSLASGKTGSFTLAVSRP